ncbi:formate dehydrogenase subunit gamma [Desulfotalea psychrophila]|uniref:Probable formate dehydrogenase, gamma subunit (Cytochrome B subunit) n=1 Tax=Desulfotalea psychrophila (strain LSv54 / DSM 12343) TaxID=177439 RepID=Q6AMC9_DESPS|nr:formate dehydrogenase subunit gamma [Desulfotalea psychrophila]CAG36496.1 probable formate dehydrogenase, gamma subunit (cytochrome B subunit) [Desulfotalea psychrophila LSv54]
MQKTTQSGLLSGLTVLLFLTFGAVSAWATASSPEYYQRLITGIVGEDWQKYGALFTLLQSHYFMWIFLLLITAVPLIFALHYLIIGAKHFDHGGKQILFFPLFSRLIHLLGAVSFTALVITGLLITFASFFGGGTFIRSARYVHLFAAFLALPALLLMLVIWLKDMLPAMCDIKWCLILGGYLSKKKVPVPAEKFNAGQKMWYWCAVPGGLIMAFTGFYLWSFGINIDLIRIYAIIHNVLGMILVAFYLTHCYMSIFAIAGSLKSMKTGYKPQEEVDILHSLHKYE